MFLEEAYADTQALQRLRRAEFLPDGKQEALAKVEQGHWCNLAACLGVLIRRLQGHSITDQTALRSDISRRAQG